MGPGSYSQALFQSVLSRAGWDPAITPIQKGNCTTGGCVIPWGTGSRSVSSVVLIANGICFAIMTVIFVTLGSAADYGNFGKWLFLFLTIVVSLRILDLSILLIIKVLDFPIRNDYHQRSQPVARGDAIIYHIIHLIWS